MDFPTSFLVNRNVIPEIEISALDMSNEFTKILTMTYLGKQARNRIILGLTR